MTLPPPSPTKLNLVADTGAGIGRVTVNLLAQVSRHVDVIEPIPKFTEQLKSDHPELFAGKEPVVGKVVTAGLESWDPAKDDPQRRYDVIWNQWCLGHLTDQALTEYLRRLIPVLSPGGWIVVKENVLGSTGDGSKGRTVRVGGKRKHIVLGDTGEGSKGRIVAVSGKGKQKKKHGGKYLLKPEWRDDSESGSDGRDGVDDGAVEEENGHDAASSDEQGEDDHEQEDEYDPIDSSVTRTERKFTRIFIDAGLKVVKTELQRGFGKELGLFPVRMWGLQPASG